MLRTHQNAGEFAFYGCLRLKIEDIGFYYPSDEVLSKKGVVEFQKLKPMVENNGDPEWIRRYSAEENTYANLSANQIMNMREINPHRGLAQPADTARYFVLKRKISHCSQKKTCLF